MNYYEEIKEQIINNEVTKRVKDYSKNRSDLTTYYNVGKLLFDAGKHYGEGIIREYSKKLTVEFGKKYTARTLFRIRQFYILFSDEKVSTLSTQLTWSHYSELIILENINEINYYVWLCNNQNLSVRQLRERIKNKEYERLDENTKLKLINNENTDIKDFVKNPIIIKSNELIDKISEKKLQKLILEDLPSFLKELGTGFSFIDNEYKIKMGDTYNFIDLLLFNYEYNCFVIVELKVTSLKKEHIGQIEVYMNYVDENLKKINQNKTIGIIMVEKENDLIIKYCSDKRILSRKFLVQVSQEDEILC